MRRLATVMLVTVAAVAQAQESIELLLDRGYVTEWLVCAPFGPDVAGGIIEALKRGEAPLADRVFMEPAGGISRLRPKALGQVSDGEGSLTWQ